MERLTSSSPSEEYDGSGGGSGSGTSPSSLFAAASAAAGGCSSHDAHSRATPRTSGGDSSDGNLLEQGASSSNGMNNKGRSAKRTARGKACERCRRMKIKCDGTTPVCGTCRKRSLQCVFTVIERPQKPRRRDEYVQALENRLNRIESLVQASGILEEEKNAVAAAAPPEEEEEPNGNAYAEDDVDVDFGSVMAGAEIAAAAGPSGSGRERLNSDFWRHCIRKSNRRPDWINDIIEGVVSRGLGLAVDPLPGSRCWSTYTQLPPTDELLSLVSDFFATCNDLVPLYHQDTFMFQLHENLSTGINRSAGWWASLNTVLALGHISRTKSTFFPQEQEKKAWQYMKGALAIQAEQPALDFDVTSVQALVGMALFFQITSFNSQMPSMMLATAIRIAQGIGLHVNSDDPNISAVEREQRRRVFWIAYLFDRELSLRTGRPPLQDDDDMCLNLPQDNPPDKVGYVGSAHIFKAKCIFAQIQGKVYKQLYSDQSWKQTCEETLAAVGNLSNELEKWRVSIPTDIRPGHPIRDLPAPYNSHILVLHFCYWYCFGLIHRRYAVCVKVTSDRPDSAAVSESISPTMPGSYVTDAARSMVQLLRNHPPSAKGTRWYTLYYSAAALVTLFGGIINDPASKTADADLDHIRVVLRFLGLICEEDNRDAHSLFGLCAKLERIAVDVLEKTRADEPRHTPPEQQQEQRAELDRQIQRQLHLHGRFFSPLDV